MSLIDVNPVVLRRFSEALRNHANMFANLPGLDSHPAIKQITKAQAEICSLLAQIVENELTPSPPSEQLQSLSDSFRKEVQEKLGVVFHRGVNRVLDEESRTTLTQCEDFLVEQFESSLHLALSNSRENLRSSSDKLPP